MTSTIAGTESLREDARQRVRVPAPRREALLDEFEKSALSAARFARLVGVKYPTFANWVARRRKQRAVVQEVAADDLSASGSVGRGTPPLRLFEAVVGDGRVEPLRTCLGEGLVIELPGGSRVLIGSPLQLPMVAELVALLAQSARRPC
jgi:hypothetical protein